MPDPFARGRRVQEVPGVLGLKLRGQPGRVFREFESEAIDHMLAPLEPAGDVVVRQVLDDILEELIDEVVHRQLSKLALEWGDGAHRGLLKSGDESSMGAARSSSRQLLLVELPPTPIFMETLYEHMFAMSRILSSPGLALGGLSTLVVLDAGRWMFAHAARDCQ